MNLLIYYNINHGNFYQVYTNYIPMDREVGFVNQYDHMLVQILANRNNKYINVKSYHDLIKIPYEKEKLKLRIINKLIRWLYKLRG